MRARSGENSRRLRPNESKIAATPALASTRLPSVTSPRRATHGATATRTRTTSSFRSARLSSSWLTSIAGTFPDRNQAVLSPAVSEKPCASALHWRHCGAFNGSFRRAALPRRPRQIRERTRIRRRRQEIDPFAGSRVPVLTKIPEHVHQCIPDRARTLQRARDSGRQSDALSERGPDSLAWPSESKAPALRVEAHHSTMPQPTDEYDHPAPSTRKRERTHRHARPHESAPRYH